MTDAAPSPYTALYRIGGAAGLVAALIFRRNISAELSLIGITPPITGADALALLQARPLLGLATLNACDLINYALLAVLIFAVCAALRRERPALMLLAGSLALIGVVAFFAGNQAFALLALGHRAAAGGDPQAAILAEADKLLMINAQGVGVRLGLLAVTLGGLLSAIGMLGSAVFRRGVAILGIVAHGLVLLAFPVMVAAPAWLWLPHSLAAVPLVVWEALTGIRLWRVGASV